MSIQWVFPKFADWRPHRAAGALSLAAFLLSGCGAKQNALTLTLTPAGSAVVVNGTISIAPSTIDTAGVTWSVTGNGCSGAACGTFSAPTSLNGVAVTYTAPSAPGVYTLTATSKSNPSRIASVDVGVTDLAGVTTYHNDGARDGVNAQEYALNPKTVGPNTFGKLFSCPVDGAIYAQPLWVPALTIGSARHNVIFVATQHDSLYAFDADATPCSQLWHVNLLDQAHGGLAGETSVTSSGPASLVGNGFGDIAPEAGVTGTPVIDPSTNTLYLVSKSVVAGTTNFSQRLHAIDLLTGNEKLSGPVTIAATFPSSQGWTDSFDARQENERAGLALVNGVVYIAWASHEDAGQYYGWVIGYKASDLSQVGVFNDAPSTSEGGIWMSGAAPAADAQNHIYVITGNARYDAGNATPPNDDYGDSLLQLNGDLTVAQAFTPSDESSDDDNDQDFGAGGTAVLVDLPPNGSNPTQLVIGGGKDNYLYVLNREQLGGYGDENAWQRVNLGNGIFSTGAFWNSTFYIAGVKGRLKAFTLDAQTAQLNPQPAAVSGASFGFPGATPAVSSNGNQNGIVWAIDSSQYCTPSSPGCSPAVLHAFDASDIATELWNSGMNSSDAPGFPVKFAVPTIANGRVYIGTRGNNKGGADSSTSTPGELDVYGLLPE